MSDQEDGDSQIVKWIVIGFAAIEVALILAGYAKQAVTLLVCLLFFFLVGCAELHGLVEQQHQSHTTQHFGSNKTSFGYDVISLGLRWRPKMEGSCQVTADVLEGYSWQLFQGRHEVFTARIQVEF